METGNEEMNKIQGVPLRSNLSLHAMECTTYMYLAVRRESANTLFITCANCYLVKLIACYLVKLPYYYLTLPLVSLASSLEARASSTHTGTPRNKARQALLALAPSND